MTNLEEGTITLEVWDADEQDLVKVCIPLRELLTEELSALLERHVEAYMEESYG